MAKRNRNKKKSRLQKRANRIAKRSSKAKSKGRSRRGNRLADKAARIDLKRKGATKKELTAQKRLDTTDRKRTLSDDGTVSQKNRESLKSKYGIENKKPVDRLISKKQFKGEGKGLLNKDGSLTEKGERRERTKALLRGAGKKVAGSALGGAIGGATGAVVGNTIAGNKNNTRDTEKDIDVVTNAIQERKIQNSSNTFPKKSQPESATKSFATPQSAPFSVAPSAGQIAQNVGQANPFSVSGTVSPYTSQLNNENVSLFDVGGNERDAVRDNLMKQLQEQAEMDVDPEKIKRKKVREMNAEIRALEALRKDALASQQRVNRQRVGTQRAQSARAGILGSDFGTQAAENVLAYNRALEGEINNQYSSQIQNVLSQAQNRADQEVNYLRNLKESSAEGYLQALDEEQARMDQALTDTVSAMIAQGANPLDFNYQVLEDLGKKFGSNAVRVINVARQLTQKSMEEPKGFSLGKDQTRYEFNPQTGSYEVVGTGYNVGAGNATAPDGTQNQSGISPVTGKPFSDSQSKAATFAVRIEEAEKILDEGKNFFNPLTPQFMKSEDRKRFEQAEANFITAVLRRESGAAISKEEFDDAREVYIPRKTDSEAVLTQKDQARATALQGLINESVGAYEQLKSSIPSMSTQQFNEYGTIDGVKYYEGADGNLYAENEISSFNNSSFNQLGGLMEKIAGVESGGNYGALGPTIPSGSYKGQRALGKYQIMPANLSGFSGKNNGWDIQALGRPVTPQEFINSPQIQEQIASHKIAELWNKYGNEQDVASVWHSGRPLKVAQADGARDVNMSTVDYVNNVVNYT